MKRIYKALELGVLSAIGAVFILIFMIGGIAMIVLRRPTAKDLDYERKQRENKG